MMKSVAVIGTGKMGGAMARRLAATGGEVSVWDGTRSKAEALGIGRVADSPADAVRESDGVISMVTGPEEVREVYSGSDGVFAAAAGKTVVEMSTAGPGVTAELAEEAARVGARLIQAPVIGSVPAVNTGTLLILASSAAEADLDAARPVLELLGEVRYVGPLGTAPALKLVANSMLAIVTAPAAHLIPPPTGPGLHNDEVFSILSRVAPGLKVREAGFVRGVHEPPMFAMRDLLKDLDLSLATWAPDTKGSTRGLPLTSLTRELFAQVAAEHPDLDITAILKAYSPSLQGESAAPAEERPADPQAAR